MWEFLGPVKQDQITAAYDRAGFELPWGPWEPKTWREELAWAAGLWDAEGCTGLRDKATPRAQMGQRDRQVLDRFRAAVGLGSVTEGQYRGKPVFRWQVNGWRPTQAVLAMLWPFLDVVKREQFLRVMGQFYDSSVVRRKRYLTHAFCDHPDNQHARKHCRRRRRGSA